MTRNPSPGGLRQGVSARQAGTCVRRDVRADVVVPSQLGEIVALVATDADPPNSIMTLPLVEAPVVNPMPPSDDL